MFSSFVRWKSDTSCSTSQLLCVAVLKMLRKLTDTVFCDLPPLLAAVLIAVGMPSLHPAPHRHSEHYHTRSSHFAEHYSVRPDEDHDHWCPIYGAGNVSFIKHDDKPFNVVGILKKTGTPVDRTVHVPLEGIEAIHIDWKGGAPVLGLSIPREKVTMVDLTPKSITAFFIGLNLRIAAFGVQRYVNSYPQEPLLAILPGVALQELWDLISVAEKALLAVSVFVIMVGLSGMLIALLTSLNERRREMAILPSVGARPLHVLSLIVGESAMLTIAGVAAGVTLLYALLFAGQPIILSRFGLYIAIRGLSAYEVILMAIVCLAGLLIGMIPGYQIYRYSLADGLTVRV
jgi:putative ABC transport system permease protein